MCYHRSVPQFLQEIPTIATLKKQTESEPATRAASSRRTAAARDLACLCAQAAADMRGKDTVLLDLTRSTPIVDFFVITTAASGRLMRAIGGEVQARMKEHGSDRLGVEGQESTAWLLMDFGDVVLHVFSPEARNLYDLESLWADAVRVDWQKSTK